MKLTGLALTAGISAVAGAVAVLAMPKNNPTRKLAAKAATKVEDLANKLENKMTTGDMGM